MKCQQCVDEGERSRVYAGGGMVTAMGWQPFYDEDGVYHSHDPNQHISGYECSRGHRWSVTSLTPCSSCDYGVR